MDPLTGGIVAGLIANGITEVARCVTPVSAAQSRRELALEDILRKDPSVAEILQKAVVAVAKSVHFQDGRQTEKLRLFFLSPEAEAVVRQMCGLYFAPGMRSKSEGAIQQEFSLSLALYLGLDETTIRPTASLLFEILLEACDRALSVAVDKGILAGHEARSSVRHRALLDEIASIQKNVDFLLQPDRPKLEDIHQFEHKYRAQLAERHGYIVPPHFDVARKIPMKDICVPPRLALVTRNRSDQGEPVKFATFLAGLYRAVVLANPGGGKSTLASRICHDLAADHRVRILGGRQLTAALIILRDYGAAKKEHACSFVQFIELVANSHYQIPPPKGAVEYMLLNGRLMVIFDGLDELIDTRHRQEISADIESFCNLYPSVPILVTSREVGGSSNKESGGAATAGRSTDARPDSLGWQSSALVNATRPAVAALRSRFACGQNL